MAVARIDMPPLEFLTHLRMADGGPTGCEAGSPRPPILAEGKPHVCLETRGVARSEFFSAAMAPHVLVTDFGLTEGHRHRYLRVGRWPQEEVPNETPRRFRPFAAGTTRYAVLVLAP